MTLKKHGSHTRDFVCIKINGLTKHSYLQHYQYLIELDDSAICNTTTQNSVQIDHLIKNRTIVKHAVDMLITFLVSNVIMLSNIITIVEHPRHMGDVLRVH